MDFSKYLTTTIMLLIVYGVYGAISSLGVIAWLSIQNQSNISRDKPKYQPKLDIDKPKYQPILDLNSKYKCSFCNKEFSKFYNANNIEALKSIFLIQNPEVVALYNTSISRQGTHISKALKKPLNKSSKNSSSSRQNTHIENQLTLF